MAWIGGLPDHALGARVASELRACGVDTSRIVWRAEGRVGLYVVEAGVPPRPAAVLYDRAGSAATTVAPADLEGRLDGATHAVVSGVTAALEPHGAALAQRFLERAGELGARRYLDVNYRSRLWPVERARPVLRGLAAQAEVVVSSAADARTVLGLEAADGELAAPCSGRSRRRPSSPSSPTATAARRPGAPRTAPSRRRATTSRSWTGSGPATRCWPASCGRTSRAGRPAEALAAGVALGRTGLHRARRPRALRAGRRRAPAAARPGEGGPVTRRDAFATRLRRERAIAIVRADAGVEDVVRAVWAAASAWSRSA